MRRCVEVCALAAAALGCGPTSSLHVAGNRLVDGSQTVRLLGVDLPGSEYACIQGRGFFDGPTDEAAVRAVRAWHANAVRLPLNEDCWLGINGASEAYSGAPYRAAIAGYVDLLRRNGLYVILDLHWVGPGSTRAERQLPMADADHAPSFWAGVASAFRRDRGVVFDLYNEPFVADWACWRDGCTVTGTPAGDYAAAGMQALINAVRGAGAENVVLAGGLAYANDLTGWLGHAPTDPAGNLGASFHAYGWNACRDAACWRAQVGPVAAQVPVVTGEIGEDDCGHAFIDGFMAWADHAGVSYLGWAWHAGFDCRRGPGLIADWRGTPTGFGAGLAAHLGRVLP